jgi:hypothetical protein
MGGFIAVICHQVLLFICFTPDIDPWGQAQCVPLVKDR